MILFVSCLFFFSATDGPFAPSHALRINAPTINAFNTCNQLIHKNTICFESIIKESAVQKRFESAMGLLYYGKCCVYEPDFNF